MKHFFLALCLILACYGVANANLTWFGKVVDYRTGNAISGASVCAGIEGRVDLACTTSDSDGWFNVSYPDGFDSSAYDYFYLYVDSPTGLSYYNQKRCRKAPGEVTARLVPDLVHIKGRAISAETGQALPGIGVALFYPGRIWESVETDSGGWFSFEPVKAYTNIKYQYNTYGVPTEDLPPNPDGDLQYKPWGVLAPYGNGYGEYAEVSPQTTEDDQLDPALPLISSISDDIYTWVELRLPDFKTAVTNNGNYITAQSGSGCLAFNNDLSFSIPDIHYETVSYSLEFSLYRNPYDPNGLYWELDMDEVYYWTYNSEIPSLTFNSDLSFTIPCISYDGVYYELRFVRYIHPDIAGGGFIWKLVL